MFRFYIFLISDGSTLQPLLNNQDNTLMVNSGNNVFELHDINNPTGKDVDAEIKFLNKSQTENASSQTTDIISRS